MSASKPRHENRLAQETSPYLLQHAHNPVDWYPWGSEALEKAKSESKPILLSIGYAACHWCHVMERESFENEDTAALMNEHFVNIKVDREERPDIDEVYMAATVAMTGQGGWPMTVFLMPRDQKPFFAGTYFPPSDMHGRPGFPSLLSRIAHLWEHERDSLELQAGELSSQLVERAEPALPGSVGEAAIEAAVSQLKLSFDPEHGGFGGAPKFPPSMSLELLLRHHRRTGDDTALTMVSRTLDGMAAGGMYDHIGGGFARYSTDERWLVPHFEKMLYDNALLSRVYALAFQVTGQARYRRVARETLDYILREMTSPEGAFYSATDADSEGVEGKFFVWTPDELHAVLPAAQARAFAAYYDITPRGNWEGHSIPHTPRPLRDVAGELGMSDDELSTVLEQARTKLYAARKERVPPLLDDKVLTSWNGLMISSMAECGRIFDEPRYREAAARAADFLLSTMRRPDGGLFRTTRAGKTHLDGYLQDYAYLSDALIDVYEAGMGERYLSAAGELAERMQQDFADADHGGFFTTGRDHETLVVRMRDGQDGPIPAANASAARVLTRLSWHLGREAYRDLAIAALRAHGQLMERAPRAFSASLNVADMLLEGPVEAVLVGDPANDATAALERALAQHFLPNRIVVHVTGGAPCSAPPELVAGKELVDGKPALYLCRNFACERPVRDAAELDALLAKDRARATRARGKRLGSLLAGKASVEGTQRYAARFADALGSSAHRGLGRTGLLAGRIGFGGYRVDDGTPLFGEALGKALSSGCNLVDTSTNYTDGGSERMIGRQLAKLVASGELRRDEVIVVSKIGYVQGGNLDIAKQRARGRSPFPEMVEYASGCWHCIHPDWLADQLERSLERLGLQTLDVCLLHNPEYFFSDRKQRKGRVTDADRAQFYERMERAFAYLETQVAEGRIGCYGVSSNTVAHTAAADPEATELGAMLDAAKRAGGEDHHFRVLQLPVNLMEHRGVTDAIVDGATVLAAARGQGIAILANRPLNAIGDDGMLRLADPPEVAAPPRDFDAQLAQVRTLEERFDIEVVKRLPLTKVSEVQGLFRWGEELQRIQPQLQSLDHYEQVARGQIVPLISQALGKVERAVTGDARESWSAWRSVYIRALEGALAALRHRLAEQQTSRVAALIERIDAALPAHTKESLQRKALWVLTSTPGLDVVLLGMRRPAYVDDALAVMAWAPLDDPAAVYGVMDPLG